VRKWYATTNAIIPDCTKHHLPVSYHTIPNQNMSHHSIALSNQNTPTWSNGVSSIFQCTPRSSTSIRLTIPLPFPARSFARCAAPSGSLLLPLVFPPVDAFAFVVALLSAWDLFCASFCARERLVVQMLSGLALRLPYRGCAAGEGGGAESGRERAVRKKK